MPIQYFEKDPRTSPLPGGRIFGAKADDGTLIALMSKDDTTGKGDFAWHLSVSHPTRYPTWDEIKEAVYSILPKDLMYAMYFPPKKDFVNVMPNCFHVYEVLNDK